MIAALYVLPDGPYSTLHDVDSWPESRDARKYRGPYKVIAHPPCERWGRYWGGGPMLHNTPKQKLLGDDGGCFAHALWSVRTFGGALEHPEASLAWRYFGLAKPPRDGGWIKADDFGGFTCCVAQGNYGHRAQKLTWLYANKIGLPQLKWGLTPGRSRLDEGYHSKSERKGSKTKLADRLDKSENLATPIEFRDLLLSLVAT